MSETKQSSCNLGSCTEKTTETSPSNAPHVKSSIDIATAQLDKPLTKTSSTPTPTPISTPMLFWSQDPNVLFQPAHILEFFPTETMTYNQKLNAITRTVIVLTLLSFVFTRNIRLLAVAAFTMLAIFLLYFAHQRASPASDDEMEPFDLPASQIKPAAPFRGGGNLVNDPSLEQLGDRRPKTVMHTGFLPTAVDNPLGNVLITDYEFNPARPPAEPAYVDEVANNILNTTKQTIAKNNPGQPGIIDKLFNDLADQFDFEQSMRPFYATANTMIPNDQTGFAEFCYGNMVSCKEGNQFACARNGPPRYHHQ
jgi:Family of unknown function (DUF5762)